MLEDRGFLHGLSARCFSRPWRKIPHTSYALESFIQCCLSRGKETVRTPLEENELATGSHFVPEVSRHWMDLPTLGPVGGHGLPRSTARGTARPQHRAPGHRRVQLCFPHRPASPGRRRRQPSSHSVYGFGWSWAP